MGAAVDEGTKPEEEHRELTAVELTPLLNIQAGLEFAEAPRDVNEDGTYRPVRFSDSSR